jgi:hypothetical protein
VEGEQHAHQAQQVSRVIDQHHAHRVRVMPHGARLPVALMRHGETRGVRA